MTHRLRGRALLLAERTGMDADFIVRQWRLGLSYCERHGHWHPKASACPVDDTERRHSALAVGLCSVCRKRPLVNRSHCEPCRVRYNARVRARYLKAKAAKS